MRMRALTKNLIWSMAVGSPFMVVLLWTGAVQAAEDEITVDRKCKIEIATKSDYANAQQDVKTVKETLENALKKSEDMRKKVEEACKKQGGTIKIGVVRDDPKVHGGANSVGQLGRRLILIIDVDLGDIEKVDEHMTGDQDLINIATASWLTRILAHEIDHQRDSIADMRRRRRKHADPTGMAAANTPGPAVEDANLVKTQIGSLDLRTFYINAGGKTILIHPETGEVVFDGLGWLNSLKKVKKGQVQGPPSPRRDHFFDPERVFDIANEPCNENSTDPCYPMPINEDEDLDGVRTSDDNCLGLANPQQGDADGNDIGDDCEDVSPPDPECGDGFCDIEFGELRTCPADCGDFLR